MAKIIQPTIHDVLQYILGQVPNVVKSIHHARIENLSATKLSKIYFPDFKDPKPWYAGIVCGLGFFDTSGKDSFRKGLEELCPAERQTLSSKKTAVDPTLRLSDRVGIKFTHDSATEYLRFRAFGPTFTRWEKSEFLEQVKQLGRIRYDMYQASRDQP